MNEAKHKISGETIILKVGHSPVDMINLGHSQSLICDECNELLSYRSSSIRAKACFVHKSATACKKQAAYREYEGEWNKQTRSYFRPIIKNDVFSQSKQGGTTKLTVFNEEFTFCHKTKRKRADIYFEIEDSTGRTKQVFAELQNSPLKSDETKDRINHYGANSLMWFCNIKTSPVELNQSPSSIIDGLGNRFEWTKQYPDKYNELTRKLKAFKLHNHLPLLDLYYAEQEKYRRGFPLFFLDDTHVYEIVRLERDPKNGKYLAITISSPIDNFFKTKGSFKNFHNLRSALNYMG
jgi:hypothetical protein